VQTFTDSTGKSWRLDLSFGLWRKIQAETGIDLLDVATPDSKSLTQLADIRTGAIGVVLWLYVEDQAKANAITQEAFWKALDGPAINAATLALVRDLEDFSQSHPQVTTLRVATEEAMAAMDRTSDAAKAREEEIRTKCRSLLSTLGNEPASGPASSAPTPTPGEPAISSGPPKDPDETPGTVQV
jgi:hypothetical protein